LVPVQEKTKPVIEWNDFPIDSNKNGSGDSCIVLIVSSWCQPACTCTLLWHK